MNDRKVTKKLRPDGADRVYVIYGRTNPHVRLIQILHEDFYC